MSKYEIPFKIINVAKKLNASGHSIRVIKDSPTLTIYEIINDCQKDGEYVEVKILQYNGKLYVPEYYAKGEH